MDQGAFAPCRLRRRWRWWAGGWCDFFAGVCLKWGTCRKAPLIANGIQTQAEFFEGTGNSVTSSIEKNIQQITVSRRVYRSFEVGGVSSQCSSLNPAGDLMIVFAFLIP